MSEIQAPLLAALSALNAGWYAENGSSVHLGAAVLCGLFALMIWPSSS